MINDLEKHKFIINVAVILFGRTDYRVLVIKRSMREDKNPGKYGIPGGKMDHTDADFFAAGAREVEEEVGIKLNKDNPLVLLQQHKNEAGDKLYITLWATLNDLVKPRTVIDTNEVEEALWLNFDELLEMESDQFTPNTYKLLLKFLRNRNR